MQRDFQLLRELSGSQPSEEQSYFNESTAAFCDDVQRPYPSFNSDPLNLLFLPQSQERVPDFNWSLEESDTVEEGNRILFSGLRPQEEEPSTPPSSRGPLSTASPLESSFIATPNQEVDDSSSNFEVASPKESRVNSPRRKRDRKAAAKKAAKPSKAAPAKASPEEGSLKRVRYEKCESEEETIRKTRENIQERLDQLENQSFSSTKERQKIVNANQSMVTRTKALGQIAYCRERTQALRTNLTRLLAQAYASQKARNNQEAFKQNIQNLLNSSLKQFNSPSTEPGADGSLLRKRPHALSERAQALVEQALTFDASDLIRRFALPGYECSIKKGEMIYTGKFQYLTYGDTDQIKGRPKKAKSCQN